MMYTVLYRILLGGFLMLGGGVIPVSHETPGVGRVEVGVVGDFHCPYCVQYELSLYALFNT